MKKQGCVHTHLKNTLVFRIILVFSQDTINKLLLLVQDFHLDFILCGCWMAYSHAYLSPLLCFFSLSVLTRYCLCVTICIHLLKLYDHGSLSDMDVNFKEFFDYFRCANFYIEQCSIQAWTGCYTNMILKLGEDQNHLKCFLKHRFVGILSELLTQEVRGEIRDSAWSTSL